MNVYVHFRALTSDWVAIDLLTASIVAERGGTRKLLTPGVTRKD